MPPKCAAHHALTDLLQRPSGIRCVRWIGIDRPVPLPQRRTASGGPKRSTITKQATSPGKPKALPFKPATQNPEPTSFPASRTTSAKKPVAELVRTRWIALFGAGAAATCLGLFTASFLWANIGEAPRYQTGQEPCVPTGRPAIQSPIEFDLHLDKSEWRYGITKLRRRLAAKATGHVLEVAVGTGRNFEFYGWGKLTEGLVDAKERSEKSPKKKLDGTGELESFTGLDISDSMLDIGLKRIRQVIPHGEDVLPKKPAFAQLAGYGNSVSLLGGKLRFFKGDAQTALPAPPTQQQQQPPVASKTTDPNTTKYDTIIQTFGLCSVRDPTLLLRAMADRVKPETGRILLLEHGRSWWDLVNGLLDRSALGHFDRFGCWWNRDMEQIVRRAEAAIPGLEVVAFERPGWSTLGTHVWIELRVRNVAPANGDEGKMEEEKRDHGGWTSWFGSAAVLVPQKPKGSE